jgi:type IV pilus assembly protein PilQ
MHRKSILAALAAVVLVAGVQVTATADDPDAEQGTDASAPAAEASGDLTGVVVAQNPAGNPVVTLEMSGLRDYEAFVIDDPPRLVVDLHGVVSRIDEHQYPIGAAGVTRARAGQYRREPEMISRVVFDLEEPVPYDVTLEDSSLVIEFAGTSAPAAQTAWEAAEQLQPVTSFDETPAEPAPTTDVAAFDPSTPEPPAAAEPFATDPAPESAALESRSLEQDALDRLLETPTLASAQAQPEQRPIPITNFETQQIITEETVYTGKLVSLNLVDADIKQVFRLFHEISGLNFVLHPAVEGRVTIVLDNVPWDLALDLILKNNGLDKVLEGNVIRIAPTAQLASEAAQRKQLKQAEELEVEPVTITRTLSYARARDVEQVVREGGVLSARGKVIVDERTNTLIISDIPKKVAPLDILISSLDSETPQVMIEARIVETSREFIQDFGIQWGYTLLADAEHGTATNLDFPHNIRNRYNLNLGSTDTGDISGINSLAFTFGNVTDSFTLDIALDALETEGKGRILSAPKIATQNNERAEIEQGVRIPVVNTTATEINVEYVSASLRLMVTPQITAEGTIILDVQVENNSPDFVNTVGDVPPINTQRAQTKVLINDGGTTVIGGIFTIQEGVSETGVPWFRKIPVFGWLFKNRSIQNENRELLIFITPKIMKIG